MSDLDDHLMIVEFLLVAWIALVRLELHEGNRAWAAELVAWTEKALEHLALQSVYPDRPDDPNDICQTLTPRRWRRSPG